MPALLNIAAVAAGQNTIITLSDTMDGGEEEEKERRGSGRYNKIAAAKAGGRNTECRECKAKQESGNEMKAQK